MALLGSSASPAWMNVRQEAAPKVRFYFLISKQPLGLLAATEQSGPVTVRGQWHPALPQEWLQSPR